MSRKEFELRTSLTVLKQFGPEKKRNRKVTQSMELRPRQTGFESAGMSFSQLSSSQAGTTSRKRLPKIKVFNKQSLVDLIASHREVQDNARMVAEAGPSPGAYSVAATRRKLRQSPNLGISFKRVGIKQPLHMPADSRKNLISIDFSESEIGANEIQVGESEMQGVQIVDPNNRYKHPKSKLHASDMGPLAMALGGDTSIQRLPHIELTNASHPDPY